MTVITKHLAIISTIVSSGQQWWSAAVSGLLLLPVLHTSEHANTHTHTHTLTNWHDEKKKEDYPAMDFDSIVVRCNITWADNGQRWRLWPNNCLLTSTTNKQQLMAKCQLAELAISAHKTEWTKREMCGHWMTERRRNCLLSMRCLCKCHVAMLDDFFCKHCFNNKKQVLISNPVHFTVEFSLVF